MISTTDGAQEILKQDRLGRVRTARQRREELVAEFERSGMSGADFAAFAGIKYQTFATWMQKRRREKAGGDGAKPAVQWLEAVVPEKAEVGAGKSVLVVYLGGGARMAISDASEAGLAAEVLRHLGGRPRC